MKRYFVVIGGIVILAVIIIWVFRWVDQGGWPSSGPAGAPLPPHIQYVKPADGETVTESDGFCVHFNYQAGIGLGDDPQQVIRYFIDGMNVTPQVVDIVTLEYGYPDPIGEPCYTREEPLNTGWHAVKVKYEDISGEEFEYTWQFQLVDEQ